MIPRCVGARTRSYAAMEGVCPPPQGPSLQSGLCCPVLHRLIGPIRPTRGHIAISPQSGLYAMPSLCGSAEAAREWFRAFTIIPSWHAVLFDPGEPLCPVPRCRHGPSPRVERLGAPKYPAIRFTRELVFVALRFASATACQVARPPVRI